VADRYAAFASLRWSCHWFVAHADDSPEMAQQANAADRAFSRLLALISEELAATGYGTTSAGQVRDRNVAEPVASVIAVKDRFAPYPIVASATSDSRSHRSLV
jgi:hypothetical protein